MSGGFRALLKAIDEEESRWLFLFDIDGTLIDAGKKGMRALQQATQEVFGKEGPPLDLAGATDLGVIAQIFAHHEEEECPDKAELFFSTYHRILGDVLNEPTGEDRVLSSAQSLLEQLHAHPQITLAVLTGNTETGAWTKLRHYGLDGYFEFGAFGSDHADRNRLGTFALERAAQFTGTAFPVDRILVIGDTPKDIACAHAINARCVAVATGRFSEVELKAAGADFVISSLDILLD